jgi:hypothetical protein
VVLGSIGIGGIGIVGIGIVIFVKKNQTHKF